MATVYSGTRDRVACIMMLLADVLPTFQCCLIVDVFLTSKCNMWMF